LRHRLVPVFQVGNQYPLHDGVAMPVAAFLIEDHPGVREHLRLLMMDVLHAQVVGTAETTADAVEWLATHDGDWDLAVVDLILKDGMGFSVLASMTAEHKRHCVVLTNAPTPANIARCTGLGVDAVFHKTLELEAFLEYCARMPAVARSTHVTP